MKKFFIWSTNACIERILDCQKVHNYLQANGWRSVDNLSCADLIVVSTCSLTEEEDKSSEDYIRFCLKKKRKTAEIVVAGCMPVIAPDKFSRLGRFFTISPTNLEALDEIIKGKLKFKDIKEANIVIVSKFHKLLFKKWLKVLSAIRSFRNNFRFKKDFFAKCLASLKNLVFSSGSFFSTIDPFLVNSRNDFFYLKISRGCLGECSYCAKRFATGRLKSRTPEMVVKEFETGLDKGYKKFYLVTEDSGCYGIDIGRSIIDLLEMIFKTGREHEFKLVISNFNAQWLIKYYEQLERILILNQGKILYLQVPVQSGSDRILRLMNRRYSIKEVKTCLLRLKENAPDIALKTDIIVGFPGESEEDFSRTKEFMEKTKFDFADIFAFQDREKTVAHRMNGKIPQEIIENRVLQLLKMRKGGLSGTGIIFRKAVELLKDFSI